MNTVRVDPHVKILDQSVVERARRADLDAVVYAPHFTRLPEIRAEANRFSSEELLVLPAREIFTGGWNDRKHVLALGLEEPVPDFITLDAAMAELDRQDAVVLAPHPEFATVSLTEADLRAYRDVIDAVEVFNPKHLPWHNRRAQEIVAAVDLPTFASSYAHLPRSIGVASTELALDARPAGESDLLAALSDGSPRCIRRKTGRSQWSVTAGELAHLGYENTWKKANRLFLQPTEPTHPRHIAYDGRFDDSAVY